MIPGEKLSPEVFNSRVIILTLAFVILAMVGVLLAGLFVASVDNKAIFAIIGPAFSGIVGYFIGRGDRAGESMANDK